MYSQEKAQLNHDYALPVMNMIAILEEEAIEREANQIIKNEFESLVLYIDENGDLNIYDNHFKAMMSGEAKAIDNAKSFMFEQAIKLAKQRLDEIKNNDALY